MRASAMNKKKCVRQLQLDLEAQTTELSQLEARIKHRSYKLSKATFTGASLPAGLSKRPAYRNEESTS